MACDAATLRVLFRVAAGPRLGYGHLVRATSIASAMGVRPRISLRGGADARRIARRLGCTLVTGPGESAMRRVAPRLVVIDDPSARAASAWCRLSRRRRVPVASVHDLGIAYCGADLTIDGSVTQRGRPRSGPALVGPRYAILPRGAGKPGRRARAVLIALGGGPRRAMALRLARAIRRRCPRVALRIAGGLAPAPARRLPADVTWLGAQRGLGRELGRASVAVVAGGVTLYEACRAGTPAVGLAVVGAQRPTIRAFARAGAALDGGTSRRVDTAARRVAALLGDARLSRQCADRGRALVDGRGAHRVAGALLQLSTAAGPNRRGGCA